MTNPQVVGTIHSAGALRHALRLKAGAVDLLEVRADHFADDLNALRRAIPRLQFPYILTVRHPKEGGAASLSAARRLEIYREFLPGALWVDLELRSVKTLAVLFAEAKEAGALTIVSDHHFRGTPAAKTLEARRKAAFASGADLFKIATRTERPEDLSRLTTLLGRQERRPVSVMGMGPLGKVSRLLCARLGSALNYGYLDEPQVPGQWPAPILKERIAELLAEY
jgi:3-dehydroquinate dehydratase-1